MATAREKPPSGGSDFSAYPPPAPPAAANAETELEEFRRYLDKLMARGIGNVSVDAALAEFRLYQDELSRLREELRPALERDDRGEDASIPWDRDKFMAELNGRLAAKGISIDGQG